MMWLNVFAARLRALFRRDAVLDDIDDELRTHVEMLTEANVAAGMAPAEARRAALASFGSMRGIRDRAYDIRGGGLLETLWQDARIGGRMLLRGPGFTAVALLTLVLGIGANTAVFSAVNAVLLRPLPFAEPERLVMIWLTGPEAAGGDHVPLSVADLLDLRAQSRTLTSTAAYGTGAFNYTGVETPLQIRAARVTGDFFSTLGVSAALGRTIAREEERPGAPPVVVVSHRFWRDQLGADPKAIERSITLDDTPVAVVGVMPASFDFPDREIDMWTPMAIEPPTRRGPFYLTGVARLAPHASRDDALAELNAIAARVVDRPLELSGRYNVLSIREHLVGDVRPALLVLLGAVTVLLLIAAVNVANLQLVRVAGREKEIAIRAAVGASRARLVRQLLTESALLGLLGGAGGLLLAFLGVEFLAGLSIESVPRLHEASVDPVVLAWTAGVSLASGLAFGLAPAIQSSHLDLNHSLKDGGRSSDGSGRRRLRSALVACEIALAVMLLVSAGLLLKSFWRLHQADAGFAPSRVLTAVIPLPESRYGEAARVRAFFDQLLARVQALPGVESAAVANGRPPDRPAWSDSFIVEGMRPAAEAGPMVASRLEVSPDFFRTLGVRVSRGRTFRPTDTDSSARVAVVNETLARRFFAGTDPIGRTMAMGPPGLEDRPMQIVGVVGDVKYRGVAGGVDPTVYVPAAQNASDAMNLLIKTGAEPLDLARAVRGEVRALDREVPVVRLGTLEERVAQSIAQPRFRTFLVAAFSALALLLAAIGVYGVMAYSVSQRRHEIGTRMALGARTTDVVKMIVGQGMVLAAIGIAIGLAGAAAVSRALASLLYGVSATDPSVFAGVSLLIAAVSLAACCAPAVRAARIEPVAALRGE